MRRTLISRFLLRLINGYKRQVSPGLGARCRFSPTCSEYAAESIERYGPGRGLFLSAGRVLRCHPFHRGGFDPVPERSCRHANGAASN